MKKITEMTTTEIVSISIFSAIIIVMLVFLTASALGHDSRPGDTYTHLTGDDLCDGGWVHAHRYDNGTVEGWEKEGCENHNRYKQSSAPAIASCESPPDCADPPRRHRVETGQRENVGTGETSEPTPSAPSVSPKPPPPEPGPGVTPEVPKAIIDSPPQSKPKPVPPPVLEKWEIQFWKGWNFVHFPILPIDVKTIKDLYYRWRFMQALDAMIVTFKDGEWAIYRGEADNPAGAIRLTPNHALAIHLRWASWLGVYGIPLKSQDESLVGGYCAGVGFTNLPVSYKRPSDMIPDGAYMNILVEQRGKLYLINKAGDAGDEPLRKGQSVFIFPYKETLTLDLSNGKE